MKTLDQVIDAMERCSIPHYFDCNGCPYEDDVAETGFYYKDLLGVDWRAYRKERE